MSGPCRTTSFEGGGGFTVQYKAGNVAAASTYSDVTITSIDTSKTFVVGQFAGSNTEEDLTLELTSSTNVRVNRYSTDASLSYYAFYVVTSA